MNGIPAPSPTPCVALFDLDGTLTWHDTLVGFLSGYVCHHPAHWLGLWRVPPAVIGYLVFHRDRGLLKSRLIRIAMGGDSRPTIDAWAERFVAGLKSRGIFRPAALAVLEAHRAAGDHLVLLSASPDLYVPRIGRLLGFDRTLCTEVQWQNDRPDARLDGALRTRNRYGEEKSHCLAWLRTQYPGLSVTAYGNSGSDLAHLRLTDRPLLVNANKTARRAATALGIPTADWT